MGSRRFYIRRNTMNLGNMEIEYKVEATVNLGNFSNVKPQYRVLVHVPEGYTPDQVRAELKRLVDGWLEEDIAEYKDELGK